MSTRPFFSESSQFATKSQPAPIQGDGHVASNMQWESAEAALDYRYSPDLTEESQSSWSKSHAKRLFDCSCVLLAVPFLIPIIAVVAVAVRLTSRGPVLFMQRRMGAHGRPFTILKFRTMMHLERTSHNPVTTTENQRFTPVGQFLRRWKLDELPQLLNVLMGDMSLVGPRPKLLEHQVAHHCCRPGITGAATIAFAREEQILARLPDHQLDRYYSRVILPFKHKLDVEYMARATFLSDLRLIIDSALRRWDPSVVDRLLYGEVFEAEDRARRSNAPVQAVVSIRMSAMTGEDALVPEEQYTQA